MFGNSKELERKLTLVDSTKASRTSVSILADDMAEVDEKLRKMDEEVKTLTTRLTETERIVQLQTQALRQQQEWLQLLLLYTGADIKLAPAVPEHWTIEPKQPQAPPAPPGPTLVKPKK